MDPGLLGIENKIIKINKLVKKHRKYALNNCNETEL